MTTGRYGLPLDVKFCRVCTISNQRMASVVESKSRASDPKPTIYFDDEGICSACRFAEIKKTKINWQERDEMLRKLCNEHRSKTGAHDILVSGSGGKDSYFVSTLLKEKYNMHPLTVTWAPQMRTAIGQRNFDSWNRHCDNIEVTPGGDVHRKLTRLAFLNLLHAFQPFISGQRNVTPRMSVMTKIPLIMYGDSPGEYGGDLPSEPRFTTLRTTLTTTHRRRTIGLLSVVSSQPTSARNSLTLATAASIASWISRCTTGQHF